MRVVEILNKMERSKNIDGHYNHEILCHMPEIEAFIRSLQTMTLEEFALLQAGIKPVHIEKETHDGNPWYK